MLSCHKADKEGLVMVGGSGGGGGVSESKKFSFSDFLNPLIKKRL